MEEKIRKYHRGERGLESLERQYLESKRMERLIQKISDKYHIPAQKPAFRPVFISKRLSKYWGLFYSDKIVMSDNIRGMSYSTRNTLWHEIVHGVIRDNWTLVSKTIPPEEMNNGALHRFEKDVFVMAINDGSHCSYNYKLTCECGHWLKSVKRKKSHFCERCQKTLVSPTEFKRLQKVAEIKSSTFSVDITKYKPWMENKRLLYEP